MGELLTAGISQLTTKGISLNFRIIMVMELMSAGENDNVSAFSKS